LNARSRHLGFRLTAGAAFVALALVVGACAPGQRVWDWRWDVAEADRLADDRRYEEAWERYAELRARAPDALEARYLTYRMGWVEEKRGRYREAVEHYLALLEHHAIYASVEDYTARGLFRTGLILYDHLGERAEGLKMWRLVIRYFPDAEGPAWRALDSVRSHFERSGDHAEAVRFFAAEYAALHATRMGDNLLYWLAHWYRHHLGDAERALELFTLLRERYWESSLRDQGDWQIVEILHARGEYERELRFLHELAAERERSLILGPHVNATMENAAFRAGTLRLEQLDDPWGAMAEWERFLSSWRVSLLRDDAAKGIVDAAVAIGDPALVREKAAWFLEEFEESRHVPAVEAVLVRFGAGGP
jgi:hypothetical protein